MVFKRRDQRTWPQAIGDLIYPKGGWGRAVSYVFHRLRRLPDPPHRIARGIAAGVFVTFTPFFGFHFLLAGMLAMAMRGNVLASVLATFFGNPITFPLIAVTSLELGSWMLGMPGGAPLAQIFGEFSRASLELWTNSVALFTSDDAQWDQLRVFMRHVFRPYLVGGLIPGTIAGVIAYMLALPAVTVYQKRRVKRLQARYEKRRAAIARAAAAAKAD